MGPWVFIARLQFAKSVVSVQYVLHEIHLWLFPGNEQVPEILFGDGDIGLVIVFMVLGTQRHLKAVGAEHLLRRSVFAGLDLNTQTFNDYGGMGIVNIGAAIRLFFAGHLRLG